MTEDKVFNYRSEWAARRREYYNFNNLVVQSADNTLGSIEMLAELGALDLKPKFQRRNRWSVGAKSRLIESFLLNLPVPPVYLAEESGRYKVIDGKQRLTAIVEFLTGDLELKYLEFLPEFEGKRIGEFENHIRTDLLLKPLRTVTIQRQSNEELTRLVFRRLNTGGIELNRQEIRNVLFDNDLLDAIHRESSNLHLGKSLKIRSKTSPAYAKMQDVELVLRFVTLAATWREFKGDLADAMDNVLERYDPLYGDGEELMELAEKFSGTMERVVSIWGSNRFQRFEPEKYAWRNQMLVPLYDAEMVAMNGLTESDFRKLLRHKDRFINEFADLFCNDREFLKSISSGTNTPARLRYRIEAVEHVIGRVLSNDGLE